MKKESNVTSVGEVTITCPHCNADVPLSQAVVHRFREQLQADFELKRKQQDKLFAEREKDLREKQEQVEAAEKALDKQVKARVETEKAKPGNGPQRG